MANYFLVSVLALLFGTGAYAQRFPAAPARYSVQQPSRTSSFSSSPSGYTSSSGRSSYSSSSPSRSSSVSSSHSSYPSRSYVSGSSTSMVSREYRPNAVSGYYLSGGRVVTNHEPYEYLVEKPAASRVMDDKYVPVPLPGITGSNGYEQRDEELPFISVAEASGQVLENPFYVLPVQQDRETEESYSRQMNHFTQVWRTTGQPWYMFFPYVKRMEVYRCFWSEGNRSVCNDFLGIALQKAKTPEEIKTALKDYYRCLGGSRLSRYLNSDRMFYKTTPGMR